MTEGVSLSRKPMKIHFYIFPHYFPHINWACSSSNLRLSSNLRKGWSTINISNQNLNICIFLVRYKSPPNPFAVVVYQILPLRKLSGASGCPKLSGRNLLRGALINENTTKNA